MAEITHNLDLANVLRSTSCAPGASCGWWTTDAGPSPLFVIGVFLGLIALVFLANMLRSRSRD